MSLASRDISTGCDPRVLIILYEKQFCVHIGSHLDLGGISVKWDENFPYERAFPPDRMEDCFRFDYIGGKLNINNFRRNYII